MFCILGPRWIFSGSNKSSHSAWLTHCILHTAQCTLQTKYCTLHTAQCTLHNAHCTVHTLKTDHYTLHNAYKTHTNSKCTHVDALSKTESLNPVHWTAGMTNLIRRAGNWILEPLLPCDIWWFFFNTLHEFMQINHFQPSFSCTKVFKKQICNRPCYCFQNQNKHALFQQWSWSTLPTIAVSHPYH